VFFDGFRPYSFFFNEFYGWQNETISWNNCVINGDNKNVSIVAFVDAKTHKVHRAWRGNIKSGKIEEISIKGITCERDAD